jgi:hypothetical protein
VYVDREDDVSWVKTYAREWFLYQFIIGDRQLLMRRTVGEWLLLILTWPIFSSLSVLVFATGATWRMLFHAVHHETLAYVTAPKALSTLASTTSSISSTKPKKSI